MVVPFGAPLAADTPACIQTETICINQLVG